MVLSLKKILWICGILPLLTVLPALGQQVPNGSYLRSCEQFSMNGNLLTATCNTGGNPRTFRTTINIEACGSEISNATGALLCIAKAGTWGDGFAVPGGTYLQSCVRPVVSGTVLTARCKDRNGNTVSNASVDLSSCKMGNNISNVDGQLVCVR